MKSKIQAIVKKKNGKTREGKGFSRKELRKAGIDYKTALRLGILVDLRRKTLNETNIDTLKQFLTTMENVRLKKEDKE